MINLSALVRQGQYKRLSSNEYFSYIALLVSQRSTCLRLHVGAVITDNNQIVATGYNGAPKGMAHCLQEGCLIRDGHCIRCIHAEQNAILQLGNPRDYTNLVIYLTDFPCQICAKLIVQAGIKEIHFVRDYQSSTDPYSLQLFKNAGIKIVHENIKFSEIDN